MRRLWREQITLWESLSTGPIEELTGRGDHVVVRHSLRARTRQGLSVESHQAGCAFTFRDGRVIRIVATDAIDKALAAAGLSQAGA